MKIALELADGRKAADYLAQVTVADVHGDPVLVAYHGPAGSIVCGHKHESHWIEFLEDVGINERILTSYDADMVARIIPLSGTVSTVPVRSVGVYSDVGDPAIAAILTKDGIDVAHAGDPTWGEFCEQHGIYVPRQTIVQDVG